MFPATVMAPESTVETGLRANLLEELALKILYLHGELTLRELATQMHLSVAVVEELFQALRKDQQCEVKGMAGALPRIAVSGFGRTRALELLALNQYAGPAPVPLGDYVKRVRAQSVQQATIRPADVESAFRHLVVEPDIVGRLGTAVVSGTAVFLYGPTGAGKTTLAEALPEIYRDSVCIPYSVEVDNQIINLYDSAVHQRIEEYASDDADARWVLCRRPRVLVGGELTLDMLDLQLNPATKYYEAPVQMKANNGVLIIDDFGRQRVRPEELLNRWIVPLDRRLDFLTLAGGKKFEIPFDLFVVFATNLNPSELAEEAFLRRIHNKIRVADPTPGQFHKLFQRLCEQWNLIYDQSAVDGVISLITGEWGLPLRACYPRDLMLQIRWQARYEGKEPHLDRQTLVAACRNYFLSAEGS